MEPNYKKMATIRSRVTRFPKFERGFDAATALPEVDYNKKMAVVSSNKDRVDIPFW